MGVFLFLSPTEAAVGEADDANDDENDADYSSWFHVRMLQRSPTGNQLDNQDDHRDHEQQMNVSAHNMEADETKQPKNQQDNKDSPKHKNLSFEVVTSGSFRRWQPRLPKFTRRMSIFY